MKLLFFLLLLFPCFMVAQDCDIARYRQLMREANEAAFGKKPDYQLAVNKLLSAKTCQPDSEAVVNVHLVRVFEEVNRQKELAIINEREANKQKKLAIAQRDSTEFQRKIAVEEKERTQKALEIAEAGRLASRSREVLAKDKDYVVALRLAEAAFCATRNPTEDARRTLQDILNEINSTSKQDIILYSNRIKLKYSNTIKYSISPNGKFLAIIKIGAAGSVEIIDLNSFTPVRRDPYTFMLNPIENFSFSRDGNSYAAFTGYKTVVERTITGERVFTLKHKTGVYDGLYIEGKNCIISYNQKSELCQEDSSSSKLLTNFFKRYWGQKCFSPDGNYVVLSASNGDSAVWLLNLAKNDTTLLKGFNIECRNLCISNDSRLIAGGNVLGEIIVWDADSRQIRNRLKGHSSYLHDLRFSSDNSYLVSSSADRSVIIWDLKTNLIAHILKNLKDDPKKASLSENNNKLITISDKDELILWNIENEEFVRTYKTLGHHYCIEFSDDGFVRIIGGSMSLEGTQIQDFLKDTIYHLPQKDLSDVFSAKITTDNTLAAMCGLGSRAIVWDINLGQTVASINPRNALFIRDVAFSEDKKYIALAMERDGVQVWDWKSNAMDTIFKGLSWESFGKVAFTKDGNYLIGTTDEQIYVWDFYRKRLFKKLVTDQTQIWDMDISPDGKMMAVGTSGGHLIIWNLETWEKIKTIDAHDDYIQAVDFSNNGEFLASAGRDRVIKIWNVADWQKVRLLSGHEDYIFAIAFVPGDIYLLSSSGDSTIKSWRIDRDFNSRTDIFQLNENMKDFYGVPKTLYDNLGQIYNIK